MLSSTKNSEKNLVDQNYQNINQNGKDTKLPNNERDKNIIFSKSNSPNINEANTTSVLFNSLSNTPRLSNFITANVQDNLVSNMNSNEAKDEQQNEINQNKTKKDSENNNEDNYILLESDEEMEENDNENTSNNVNANQKPDNNNSSNGKMNNTSKNDNNTNFNKNNLNGQDLQKLQENKKINGDMNGTNINNKDKTQLNNKDKYIDTEGPKKIERKLYYVRKITSNRKYKLRGTDKLNIQFFIGNLKPNDLLPNFVFTSEKYYYVPHKCRQVIQNYKGYIISFPGLKKLLSDKIIKKDLEHLCTYFFKRPRRKQTSLDIQVKDEKTLNDGVFLNDGIVNFYLKIIEDEYTCGEDKANNVLVMKSFFYNFIANQENLNLSIGEFSYPDSCSFIKTKINVFSYKTLIIPTCENYHWSLIIVNDIDKMKNIFSESNLKAYHEEENFQGLGIADHSKEEGEGDYPEIFYLDSFYDISQRRMLIILKYLFYEYQKIYSIDVNMHNFLLKNYYKIECYNPDVPKQNNNYDCGIFLLMYAEMFLYNPSYFLQLISKKYKINKNKEINLVNNNNANAEDQSNVNGANNKDIINNNIINNNINLINQNNNNSNNIVNNISNNNICKINISNNINSGKENEFKNPNIIIKNNNDVKKDETFIDTENKENIDNIKEDDNKIEIDFDKIDIQIEDTKAKENEDQEMRNNDYSPNDTYQYGTNLFGNNDLNNTEIDAEDNPIRNWFSYDLINSQRAKIKNLIIELSKIDKKKDLTEKMKDQNSIIEKYMEKQKVEFDEYFAKLKE